MVEDLGRKKQWPELFPLDVQICLSDRLLPIHLYHIKTVIRTSICIQLHIYIEHIELDRRVFIPVHHVLASA